MKSFLSRNWFKLLIALAVLIVAGSLNFELHFESTSPTTVTETLPVTVLPTSDGITGEGMYSDKYPSSISIQIPATFKDQVSAYGAAYEVWLGPKGWTGKGASGVDGNAVINLYPNGGSSNTGPHITYSEIPACVGCMLDAAAPYFDSAQQEYESTYDKNETNPLNISIPSGLTVHPLSSSLVTYTIPGLASLSTTGVAYFGTQNTNSSLESNGWRHYDEAQFILPSDDQALSAYFSQYFIESKNLN